MENIEDKNQEDQQEKKKVLVAEDDRFLSRAITDKLSKEGFEVLNAFDGEEAIKLAVSKKPDIILLDIIMPKKGGFEVLEGIKIKGGTKAPVIILSNLGQESDIIRGKELGAVDYMVKSNISLKEVVSKVRYYLTKK